MPARKRPSPPFPTKEAILDFIRESPSPVGQREIARAFRLLGNNRIKLKATLKEMLEDGQITRGANRCFVVSKGLPAVTVLEITGTDADGDVLARPVSWIEKEAPPAIYVAMEQRRPALWPGERILARLREMEDGTFTANIIRRIGVEPNQILGVLQKEGKDIRLVPTDRRHKHVYRVPPDGMGDGSEGDLVFAEVTHTTPRARDARVVENFGSMRAPRAISRIAIQTHDIPMEFSTDAIAQAKQAGPATEKDRTDLRAVPLVTIDGAHARDFDDAVWAEADPKTPGHWHLLVAIADVAHYVHQDDALDRMAFERGNSVYFPDQVVPMLPEQLSNGWCSLKPGEDRPCLAAHLWIDGDGQLLRHEFQRGIMRSAARLTYEQVQRAQDGFSDATTEPLYQNVLKPLYGAYHALKKAREARGTIDLDLPEREIVLDAAGTPTAIQTAMRFDSHRLIEEFMILANVAAAETLEKHRAPCMYRVHDAPQESKLEPLREFLAAINIPLAKGQVLRPRHFNRILKQAADTPYATIVNLVVLRSQSKAEYLPENHGHFGLALSRYCHFTSPIRRYSDLLVHRALIEALRLGTDGLGTKTANRLAEIGEHISLTERRAAAAERDSVDRYGTLFLEKRVGGEFSGQINGVTRFGLFITLDESGADGFIPIRTLGWEHFVHDEVHHRLTGDQSGRTFRLGDRIRVKLVEANAVTGSLLFALLEGGATRKARKPPGGKPPGGKAPSGKAPGNKKRGKRQHQKKPPRPAPKR